MRTKWTNLSSREQHNLAKAMVDNFEDTTQEFDAADQAALSTLFDPILPDINLSRIERQLRLSEREAELYSELTFDQKILWIKETYRCHSVTAVAGLCLAELRSRLIKKGRVQEDSIQNLNDLLNYYHNLNPYYTRERVIYIACNRFYDDLHPDEDSLAPLSEFLEVTKVE